MKPKITMQNSTNLSLDDAFELFIRKAQVRNLSSRTIQSYQQHYKFFSDFALKETPIKNITSDTVDNWLIYLKKNTNANEITRNSYLRSIRAFLYYCMECNYLKSFKIRMPKAEKKIKETYTDEELSRLLEKPNTNKCSFTEYKTWVFENYLLGTGNRLSTALDVKIGDVDFQSGTITLRKTKNRKQQIIPLSHSLSDILQEYLQIRGGSQDDYLFCNIYGEHGSNRTFEDLVAKYNIKRNVNKTSIHLFRHTFARLAILNGMDCFRLQRILGHSDLTVTREYVNMFSQDLQMDFDKFNPLDNITRKGNVIKM